MSLGTSNRDGGKTSESGHLRAIQKAISGEVLNGLAISQRAAGANMSVDMAIGDAVIPRSDGTYGHPVFNDAVLNIPITAADPSNPRRDIVVLYIDYAQAVSTAVSNNTNGVVKVEVVEGTAAGSPSDPNAAAIQSAVGSGNPYIKLARVRVGAGATSIANSVIDDLRIMATGLINGGFTGISGLTFAYSSASALQVTGADATSVLAPYTKIRVYQAGTRKEFIVTTSSFSTNTTVNLDGGGVYSLTNVPIDRVEYSYDEYPPGFSITQKTDYLGNYVVSGCIWSADSAGSNRNASMTAGVVYINGKRLTVAAVSGRTNTASKDVYVDLKDNGDGTAVPVYYDNTTGAQSPTLATTTGQLRVAIIRVGASSIASADDVWCGELRPTTFLSLQSTNFNQLVVDTAGVFVRPRSPRPICVGAFVRNNTSATGAPGGSPVTYNGAPYFAINVEPYTNYELTISEPALSGASGSGEFVIIPYLSTSNASAGNRVGSRMDYRFDGTGGFTMSTKFNSGNNSGLMYIHFKFASSGWTGTLNMNADSTDRWAEADVKRVS